MQSGSAYGPMSRKVSGGLTIMALLRLSFRRRALQVPAFGLDHC
jgi:hypothetical protein